MKQNASLKYILRAGICAALCAAILLGFALPGADMVRAKPDNPLEDASIREITVLNVGDSENQLDPVVVPEGDSTESEELEQTEPQETQPEGTQDTPPEETVPSESVPEETTPEETNPDDPETGDEDEGNDDGNQGEQGGEALELELAAALTWYKYGNDPQTLACGPSSSVTKSINTAQLADNTLKYRVSLTGADAGFVDIQEVAVAAGDSAFRPIGQNGNLTIDLPGGSARNYTVRVTGMIEKPNGMGQIIRQELTFIFVLKCAYNMDLDLELLWQPENGRERSVVCGADRTEAISVKNHDLFQRVFAYRLRLTGALAENARIISGSYTTASGQESGGLEVENGSVILNPAPGKDSETYYLTFTVQTGQRDVSYSFKVMYQQTLDAQLDFHWMEKGVVQQTKTCQPGDHVTQRIKNNQLSAGAVPYRMELTGADGVEGKILSVTYVSEAGGSGNLQPQGSLPLSMPAGASSATYHILVNAMVKGQRMDFEIILYYCADVSLQMEYTVVEEDAVVTRQVLCENTRAKTAEPVYDDQLTDGMLNYTMSLTGSEGQDAVITSVTCYQSGSSRTVLLEKDGSARLLLKDGKTGENTFEIKAEDSSGNTYRFTVNIPYKHRGENNIQIKTNLTEGQTIINETKTNLTVKAWSEDDSGNVLSYIPAHGTDTKLIVQLDGQTLSYVSSSGAASEYDLFPENPEIGDTNTHILYIYAEDALGNYGELTLNLQGQRQDSGQHVGKANIYVDLTVLGLGVVEKLSYDVLADEPVSYVIAKAILGMDTGHPYGKASETTGWQGRYAGTLDNGFYLQSLTTGLSANALEGGKWPGKTEEEILKAIDERFGPGTGLATLWRCLYRNGLNKSTGSGGTFSEFDYTSGSGWMYSVGGSTYYPGQSMSSVYLQDGDTLIVRFTLAYGWDVGGGSPGYGSTVGYCVSASNGNFRVNHIMEPVTNPDGTTVNVCHCCGMAEDCLHANSAVVDLEDGTHVRFCGDCQKELGDPEDHSWADEDAATDAHVCADCGAAESHIWQEVAGSNTATCTEPGVRMVQCGICKLSREEQSSPKGHTRDNQWLVTAEEHYEKCSTCGDIANRGRHQYAPVAYQENGAQKETFECIICRAWHVDECGATPAKSSATCQKITYYCGGCGYSMTVTGSFPENHAYSEGKCRHCGEPDPNGAKPEDAGDDPEG